MTSGRTLALRGEQCLRLHPVSFSHVAFIFLLAIVSNVILAAILPKIEPSGEVTRIAGSIANGQGFSSPFRKPTGPSAWIPPAYPFLLAGIFRIFGAFTATSYWIATAVNIVVHAVACVVLYRAAGETFGQRVGLYSACALASFPLLFYPVLLLQVLGQMEQDALFLLPNLIWYTHFSELAILLLLWLTLHPPRWIVYGTAWGVASLFNPSILALGPAFCGWRFWRRESWRYMSLTIGVAALCVTPWLVRNYLVFHRLVFIRDDFGVELRVGNQPGQDGRWDGDVHPSSSDYELSRVVKLGEVGYAQVAGQEALYTIRSHPGNFLHSTILRVGYWWIGNPMTSHRLGKLGFVKHLPQLIFAVLAFYGIGRALRHRNANALLFVAVLLFYPLIFYITHTFGGFFYQYPIHPEMLALAVSGIVRADISKRRNSKGVHLMVPATAGRMGIGQVRMDNSDMDQTPKRRRQSWRDGR